MFNLHQVVTRLIAGVVLAASVALSASANTNDAQHCIKWYESGKQTYIKNTCVASVHFVHQRADGRKQRERLYPQQSKRIKSADWLLGVWGACKSPARVDWDADGTYDCK